jgi:O-antigen ligase
MLWTTAWQMFTDHPLLGVGPYNYRWFYPNYTGEPLDVTHTHSLFFGLLADTGILGLAAFLWMLFHLAQAAWRGRRVVRPSGSLWVWWSALLASLLAWFIHGLVGFPFTGLDTAIPFWLLASLLVSMSMRADTWSDSEGA